MAKGGGSENPSYYKSLIHYLDIENIHKVRDSYKNMRSLCTQQEVNNWYSSLEKTDWLEQVS